MRRAAIYALIVTAALLAAAECSAAERSWLALGDSYSSGEGIFDVEGDKVLGGKKFQKRNCQRARGVKGQGSTWSVVAYELLPSNLGFSDMDLVACTGATTDEIGGQITEAETRGGRELWDVASLSVGGNNLDFTGVAKDCLGWDGPHWYSVDNIDPGCNVTDEQLRARIEKLVGARDDAQGFNGSTEIEDVFDEVALEVRDGGDVIVVGYPQLFEEPDRWNDFNKDVGRCEGFAPTDVLMLRGVIGYLNEQLGQAVLAADERHRVADGVRFHFVDIAGDPYEESKDPSSRHGLCTQNEWLNGFDGLGKNQRLATALHPNQRGYSATGRVVAGLFRFGDIVFDDLVLTHAGDSCGRVEASGNDGKPVLSKIDVDAGAILCRTARELWKNYWPSGRDCQGQPTSICFVTFKGWRCAAPSNASLYPVNFSCEQVGGPGRLTGTDPLAGVPTVVGALDLGCPDCSAVESVRPPSLGPLSTSGGLVSGVQLTDLDWQEWSPSGATGTGSVEVFVGDGSQSGSATVELGNLTPHVADGCGNEGTGSIFTQAVVTLAGVDPSVDGEPIYIQLPPTGCETF